jgi:primosomal replication protein N
MEINENEVFLTGIVVKQGTETTTKTGLKCCSLVVRTLKGTTAKINFYGDLLEKIKMIELGSLVTIKGNLMNRMVDNKYKVLEILGLDIDLIKTKEETDDDKKTKRK